MTERRQIEPLKDRGKGLDILRWDLEEKGDSLLQRVNQESSDGEYTFRIFTATDEIMYFGELNRIFAVADKKLILDNPLEKVQNINFELSKKHRDNSPRITTEINLEDQVMGIEEIDRGNSTDSIPPNTRNDFLNLANDIAGYYLAKVREQRKYNLMETLNCKYEE